MNRRSFLKNSAAVTALSCLAPSFLKAAEKSPFEWKRLGDDIGYFKLSGGTMGWMITADAFVVIDSQFPKNATQFLSKAREETSRKIDFLINTHHHGDHTKGNKILIPESVNSIAHEKCVLWQRKASKKPEAEVVAAATFSDEWRQDIPGEKMTAKYYGEAHTSGDIVIHFQNRNVAHVGDLVFNHHPPYIDRGAGANISKWIQVLEKLHSEFNDETEFIFGHGLPHVGVAGKRVRLLEMRDFLSGILDFTSKEIKAGASIDEVKQTLKVPGFEDYFMDSWSTAIPNALAVAYQELTEANS